MQDKTAEMQSLFVKALELISQVYYLSCKIAKTRKWKTLLSPTDTIQPLHRQGR